MEFLHLGKEEEEKEGKGEGEGEGDFCTPPPALTCTGWRAEGEGWNYLIFPKSLGINGEKS